MDRDRGDLAKFAREVNASVDAIRELGKHATIGQDFMLEGDKDENELIAGLCEERGIPINYVGEGCYSTAYTQELLDQHEEKR